MEQERLDKLLNKQWVGSQLEQFWIRHGFKSVLELQAKTGQTNLAAYAKGRAFPSWQGLVLIANACKSDVGTLVKMIDPDGGNQNEKVPVEHKRTVHLLLELLAKAPEDARRWIIGNIETFYKAYLGRRADR